MKILPEIYLWTRAASTAGRYSNSSVVSVSFWQIYYSGVIGHGSRVEVSWSRDANDDIPCRYVTHQWPWSVDTGEWEERAGRLVKISVRLQAAIPLTAPPLVYKSCCLFADLLLTVHILIGLKQCATLKFS